MSSLAHILDVFGPGLARVAASYEADRFLREDLLQDIFLAIHQALPSLNNSQSLAPFVFRIAHNRGVSHVVRQMGMKRASTAVEGPHQEDTPEEAMLASERSRRLGAAVRQLPLPYRQVMTLVLEELTYAEIAEALGITGSNVGVRLNRARVQLRKLLKDDE